MMLSEGLSELERGLREAEPSGRQLRYAHLRHFSELVQELTCSLASYAALALTLETDELPSLGPVYAVYLRIEALEMFEARPQGEETCVALWIDAVPL